MIFPKYISILLIIVAAYTATMCSNSNELKESYFKLPMKKAYTYTGYLVDIGEKAQRSHTVTNITVVNKTLNKSTNTYEIDIIYSFKGRDIIMSDTIYINIDEGTASDSEMKDRSIKLQLVDRNDKKATKWSRGKFKYNILEEYSAEFHGQEYKITVLEISPKNKELIPMKYIFHLNSELGVYKSIITDYADNVEYHASLIEIIPHE